VLIKPLSLLYNIINCMNIEKEQRGEEESESRKTQIILHVE
jgi:hypothetical protein